jgi:pilus assembly protein CpaF
MSVAQVEPEVVDRVRERLAGRPGDLSPHRVAEALRAAGRPVGDATVLAVYEALRRDVLGAGPLEPLLRLPGVTDVLVNGPEQVYVDRGDGLEATAVRFADDESVRRLAQRLAAMAGRRLDDNAPFADLRLPDGSRCHAVLAPVSRPGTTISLRVPPARSFTLDELVAAGTLTDRGAELLKALVDARVAFLVSGGTGSGKTTLLAALLTLVDPGERLVLVEDAAELRPDHPHVVALEGRPPNVEGAGAIDLRTLVRQALRMRPDRLVVGEVRGAEVVELLAALNTGHEGGCGTLHANSAADVPARWRHWPWPPGSTEPRRTASWPRVSRRLCTWPGAGTAYAGWPRSRSPREALTGWWPWSPPSLSSTGSSERAPARPSWPGCCGCERRGWLSMLSLLSAVAAAALLAPPRPRLPSPRERLPARRRPVSLLLLVPLLAWVPPAGWSPRSSAWARSRSAGGCGCAGESGVPPRRPAGGSSRCASTSPPSCPPGSHPVRRWRARPTTGPPWLLRPRPSASGRTCRPPCARSPGGPARET